MSQEHNTREVELLITLDHDLGDSNDDNCLMIRDEDRHLEFERLRDPTKPHTIKWTLSGNAARGHFCAINEAANPGFLWLVRTPAGNHFRNLLQVSERQMTIANRHCNQESKGHWFYQLFARFPNGRVYGVPLTFAAGNAGNTNPSIRNR